jgi:hypothetical protein
MEAVRRLSQDLYLPDAGPVRDEGDKAVFIGSACLVRLAVTGAVDVVLGITGRVIGRIKNPHRYALLLDIVVYGVGIDRGIESIKTKNAKN